MEGRREGGREEGRKEGKEECFRNLQVIKLYQQRQASI
jgi:hypothetical protein